MSKKKLKEQLAKKAKLIKLIETRQAQFPKAKDRSRRVWVTRTYGLLGSDALETHYDRMEASAVSYLESKNDGDSGKAREALSEYLDVIRNILVTENLLRRTNLSKAADMIIEDLRHAIECFGTEYEHPLFPRKKSGRRSRAPLRNQYLVQISAAISHSIAYGDMQEDNACKYIAQRLTSAQKGELRPERPGSAANKGTLWGYLRSERRRVIGGKYGVRGSKQHDYFFLNGFDGAAPASPSSLKPYQRIISPNFDIDASIVLLEEMGRPKPVK